MARNKSLARRKGKPKYDKRMLIFLGLSLILVLMMILAMFLPSLPQ